MNHHEIEAGPGCDLLIATEVLKLRTGTRCHGSGVWTTPDGKIWRRLRAYSTDPTACMAALEKFNEWGSHKNILGHHVWIRVSLGTSGDGFEKYRMVNAPAPTFTLAACRAMLEAKSA